MFEPRALISKYRSKEPVFSGSFFTDGDEGMILPELPQAGAIDGDPLTVAERLTRRPSSLLTDPRWSRGGLRRLAVRSWARDHPPNARRTWSTSVRSAGPPGAFGPT